MDPDNTPSDDEALFAQEPEAFCAADPDRKEQERLEKNLREEIKAEGNKPPKGWRVDSFARTVGPPRLVAVPPWSL